ncbi:MAG: hypothetical protein LBR37_01145 [Erysipelotrichaceae bacterium]|jgi:MFS family permease|nr:hypothetical protein [Erysipelotrichaceae bacterium]
MKLRKRVGFFQNISFIAIVAAFNALLSLINSLIPFAAFVIIFIFPLVSAMLALYVEKKYLPIYIAITILVSLALSFFNLANTIFYLLPGLFVGIFIGLAKRYQLNDIFIILIATIILIMITILIIPLINVLFEIDFVSNILKLLGLSDFQFKDLALILILIIFNAAEATITTFIIFEELNKITPDLPIKKHNTFLISLVASLVSALGIICLFTNLHPILVYICFIIGVFLGIYLFIIVTTKYRLRLINMGLFLMIGILLSAFFHNYLVNPNGILLFFLPIIGNSFFTLVYTIIKEKKHARPH